MDQVSDSSSLTFAKSAIERGDLPELQCVLEKSQWDIGSEPLDSEGQTALHIACANDGHLDIVQYLVNERECSMLKENHDQVTPIVIAWINNCYQVTAFLLKSIKEKGIFAEAKLSPKSLSKLLETLQLGSDTDIRNAIKMFSLECVTREVLMQ